MTVFNIAGISGASMAQMQGALKEQYFPKWNDMINPEAKLWSKIAKREGDIIGGIQTLFSVMDRHVASAGMPLLENFDMVTPTAPNYSKPAIWPVEHYSRVRSTGKAERAARAGDTATYVQVFKEQLRSCREQHHLMRNIEAYLGVLSPFAQISAYTHATSLHTVYGRSSRNSTANRRWVSGTKYLLEGQSYGIVPTTVNGTVIQHGVPGWDMSGVTPANERQILSIIDDTSFVGTTAGGTALASDPVDYSALSDGALVIMYGSRLLAFDTTDDADADSKSGHGNGLMNMLGNATTKAFLYSLSKTSSAFLNSVYDANAGTLRDWDENELTFVFDQSAENRYNNGGRIDTVQMGRAVRREYIRETKGDRLFDPMLNKKGWGPKLLFTAGDVAAMIEVDRHCPDFLAFGLDTSSFKRYENAPLQAMDKNHDDRYIANKDSHEIPLVEADNLACINPPGNAVVEDILCSTTGLL